MIASEELSDDYLAEAQQYGESLIRIREYGRSGSLTGRQLETLTAHEGDIETLGLSLQPLRDGDLELVAGSRVGSITLGGSGFRLMIVVEAKVSDADLFSMLDRSHDQLNRQSDRSGAFLSANGDPSGVFLAFVAQSLREFCDKNAFRAYHYADLEERGRIRGRPLVRDYTRRSVFRGKPHVVPTRQLDYSPDVVENQILSYTIQVTGQLVQALELGSSGQAIQDQLALARRNLPASHPVRVSSAEIRRLRYTRRTEHFQPIHELCASVLDGRTLSLSPGHQVETGGFSFDMPGLFENYVAAAGRAAWGGDFESNKERLTYATAFDDRPIELDGRLNRAGRTIVIEAKYAQVPMDGERLVLNRIPERHVYQTIAYCGHRDVLGTDGVIVYPTWERGEAATALHGPIEDFGRSPDGPGHLRLWLLGLRLNAPFPEMVRSLRETLTAI